MATEVSEKLFSPLSMITRNTNRSESHIRAIQSPLPDCRRNRNAANMALQLNQSSLCYGSAARSYSSPLQLTFRYLVLCHEQILCDTISSYERGHSDAWALIGILWKFLGAEDRPQSHYSYPLSVRLVVATDDRHEISIVLEIIQWDEFQLSLPRYSSVGTMVVQKLHSHLFTFASFRV